ncbi:hypothetical protein K6Y83_38540, partial [Burkholderia cenocepacia]|nr:hypothetical protein [Burkholderia cenocepacia]
TDSRWLAERDFRTKPPHTQKIGHAPYTLNDSFGSAFTPEVYDAWAAAYGLIAQTAIAAAYPKDKELFPSIA